MKWHQVREHFPHQWLLVEATKAHSVDERRILDDLAVVDHIADRVGVLYLGRLVEEATRQQVFSSPQHPYTASLLSAVPVPVARRGSRAGLTRLRLTGEPPSSVDLPAGCPFHPRCPIAQARCESETPSLAAVEDGHLVACHFPGEIRV